MTPGFNRKERIVVTYLLNYTYLLLSHMYIHTYENVLVVHFDLQVALLATLKIVYNPDLVYKRVVTDLYTKSGFDCN